MTQLTFTDLECGVLAALETYSNVHRGSGHNSMVSTYLYEQARDIILEHMGLSKSKYVVIFCTPERAEALKNLVVAKNYKIISSHDFGLPLGVRAVAVRRKALPRGVPFQTGGGTTRLISRNKVIWADAPDRFEAGTPAIINIIAFARALRLIQKSGKDIFINQGTGDLNAHDILYSDELEKYSGQELLDELRKALIGRNLMVPTTEGASPFINLDNSASTPTFTPIWKAVCNTWHQPRQVQQEIINEVRSVCSVFLDAPPDLYDVIFTSNATEAINLAARSLGHEAEPDIEPVILNTLLEHSSNDLPWRTASRSPLIRISIDTEGFVDMNQMETLLKEYNQNYLYGKKRIRLVTVTGASNVLGVFNDLADISRIVHKYGARLAVDAAQMIAHRRVAMAECGIDYLALSAHKIYAPFGCGVLVAKKGLLSFTPDEMELVRSSGEENTGGIAALGKALVLLQRIGMDLIRKEERELTAKTLHGLALIDGLRVYGITNPDSPRFDKKGGVIVFDLKGILSPKVARELAERGGIGVRYGCHCAHILIKHLVGVPPSLERFQSIIQTLLPNLKFPGLVRVSLGIENRKEDIDTLIRVLRIIASKVKTTSANEPEVVPKAEIKKKIDDFIRAAALRVYS